MRRVNPLRWAAIVTDFHQSEPSYNSSYDYLDQSFGLIDESDNRWQQLRDEVIRLNDEAEKGTSHKVFFLGRHGEGFHNVAERRYGTPEWDRFWSKQNGDDDLTVREEIAARKRTSR